MTTIHTLVNPNDLTAAQQVFAAFYAIFFGIMLQTIGARRSKVKSKFKKLKKEKYNSDVTYNLFDTPNAWAIGLRYDNKPLWRLLFSILCLNILPGYIFALIFNGLSYVDNPTLIQVIQLVWISLIPQYIYRVYMAVLVHFKEDLYLKEEEYPDYNTHDLYALDLIGADRSQHKAHSSFINHAAFPVFFVFPSNIICYYLLAPTQIQFALVYSSLVFITIGLLFFILPRRLKN